MIDGKIADLISLVRRNLFQWRLRETAKVELLAMSENATFSVSDDNGRRIIRVYRQGYHTDAEISSELAWQRAIEQSGIVTVPHVYKTLSDTFLVSSGCSRLACFTFMHGYEPSPNNDLIYWFYKLGVISARLHCQSNSWQMPYGFTRKHWTYETMIGRQAYWGDWRNAVGLTGRDREILELCDRSLRHITSLFPRDKANYGLIHGDLRLANLLVNNDHLVAIDFDDCGFSWHALDLANSLSFIEDNPLVPELIEAWFQGYQQIMPVLSEMRMMMPHLIMMRRIQLCAWLSSHSLVPTALALGKTFVRGTIELAERYLTTQNLRSVQ